MRTATNLYSYIVVLACVRTKTCCGRRGRCVPLGGGRHHRTSVVGDGHIWFSLVWFAVSPPHLRTIHRRFGAGRAADNNAPLARGEQHAWHAAYVVATYQALAISLSCALTREWCLYANCVSRRVVVRQNAALSCLPRSLPATATAISWRSQ